MTSRTGKNIDNHKTNLAKRAIKESSDWNLTHVKAAYSTYGDDRKHALDEVLKALSYVKSTAVKAENLIYKTPVFDVEMQNLEQSVYEFLEKPLHKGLPEKVSSMISEIKDNTRRQAYLDCVKMIKEVKSDKDLADKHGDEFLDSFLDFYMLAFIEPRIAEKKAQADDIRKEVLKDYLAEINEGRAVLSSKARDYLLNVLKESSKLNSSTINNLLQDKEFKEEMFYRVSNNPKIKAIVAEGIVSEPQKKHSAVTAFDVSNTESVLYTARQLLENMMKNAKSSSSKNLLKCMISRTKDYEYLINSGAIEDNLVNFYITELNLPDSYNEYSSELGGEALFLGLKGLVENIAEAEISDLEFYEMLDNENINGLFTSTDALKKLRRVFEKKGFDFEDKRTAGLVRKLQEDNTLHKRYTDLISRIAKDNNEQKEVIKEFTGFDSFADTAKKYGVQKAELDAIANYYCTNSMFNEANDKVTIPESLRKGLEDSVKYLETIGSISESLADAWKNMGHEDVINGKDLFRLIQDILSIGATGYSGLIPAVLDVYIKEGIEGVNKYFQDKKNSKTN